MNKPPKVVVVIPNWDGAASLPASLDSLLAQSVPAHIIVVDNGSTDGSVKLLQTAYPQVELIRHDRNRGYAGGVNPGFKRAIELGATYAAPFNNDAVADRRWLEHLCDFLDSHPDVGIAAPKVASVDGSHLDSTGDYYTVWGLAYPRGRNEADHGQYDTPEYVSTFAASGAASLYRTSLLRQVGLLDEDFFAYYEDVDISFRAQLVGWKIAYIASSRVLHDQGTTSRRLRGFSVYQTIKNYPWLLIKNVPGPLLPRIVPRFLLAYTLFCGKALTHRNIQATVKGIAKMLILLPKKLVERRRIQAARTVSADYIWSAITHDLPPNATSLRRLRNSWWRLTDRDKHKKGEGI